METAANTPIINSWQWPKAKELPSCSEPSPSPDFSAEEQPTITDLTHQNVCSLPIGSLSNLSRSVSLNSSKSFASISTACDSCDAQKEHLSHSPGSHYSSTANSLVICNFNTSNPSIDGEFDNEPTDDEEGNFTDDEDEPEDDIDIISYRSGFSDSALASDILLAYEDEPDAEEGIPGSSQMASKQRRHILFLETHAIGRPSLAGHCEFYPLIVDKICSQSDLHQLNKYIFLLDQFARLCANYCGEEGSFRRCSFYPFLFPHPLPSQAQRPLSLRRNKYLRKQYSNCNYPLLSDYSVNSRGPNRLSKCSKAPLSYLDRPFLETYLRLIELFNQANAHKNAEEHENENGSFESGLGSLKVAHFSLKIFAQFPELIRDDLLDGSRSFQSLPRMIEHLLDPFARYEPMDNYRFVAVIRTHFHCLEEETEALSELPVEPLRIEQVFGSLYERYHLPQLFQLYHSVSRYIRTIFCKSVYRRYPEARHFDGEQKTELLNKFYELTFRHRKAPLLDTLHDLSLHTSGHVLNNDDYHRSLLVFCYRSTLYRYAHCVSSSLDRDYVHCDPTMSSSGAGSHSYDQHPIRHINEPLCSSLVGYLYKLTIQLALLASVYSPPQGQSFMELLLKIQVYGMFVCVLKIWAYKLYYNCISITLWKIPIPNKSTFYK